MGAGTINGLAFEPGPETGAPLLLDLPAWFEARVTDMVKRGDHTVVVAEVINAGLRNPDATYTFTSHAVSHGVVYQTARTDLLELVSRGLLVSRKDGRTYVFSPPPDLDRGLRDAE